MNPIVGELEIKSDSDNVHTISPLLSDRSLQNARPNQPVLDPRQQMLGSNLVLSGGSQPAFRFSRQLRSMGRCKTEGQRRMRIRKSVAGSSSSNHSRSISRKMRRSNPRPPSNVSSVIDSRPPRLSQFASPGMNNMSSSSEDLMINED